MLEISHAPFQSTDLHPLPLGGSSGSRPSLVSCSGLAFDLWFTFVPALITLGRLCGPFLMLSKAFNAYLSACVCHLVDTAERSFSVAPGHPHPGEGQMSNELKFLS